MVLRKDNLFTISDLSQVASNINIKNIGYLGGALKYYRETKNCKIRT